MAVVPGLLCQSHNASCHKAVERTPMSSNQFQKPAPAEAERVTYLARLDFSNQNSGLSLPRIDRQPTVFSHTVSLKQWETAPAKQTLGDFLSR
jgi:hypothetical protein